MKTDPHFDQSLPMAHVNIIWDAYPPYIRYMLCALSLIGSAYVTTPFKSTKFDNSEALAYCLFAATNKYIGKSVNEYYTQFFGRIHNLISGLFVVAKNTMNINGEVYKADTAVSVLIPIKNNSYIYPVFLTHDIIHYDEIQTIYPRSTFKLDYKFLDIKTYLAAESTTSDQLEKLGVAWK